jgi:hypothetical protein
MLNECGGCVAGELKIESLIMGACVLPSQAFAGVWPTFVISLAGAVRKGLSFVVASSRAFSLAHTLGPAPPSRFRLRGQHQDASKSCELGRPTSTPCRNRGLPLGAQRCREAPASGRYFETGPKKCSWITRCSSQAIANSGGKS